MNSAVTPIFNKNFVEKKRFVGPVNSARDPLTTHFGENFSSQRGSGSRAQCTGPTNKQNSM